MKKISKQKAIEVILSELEKGTTYSDCLSVYVSKWHVTDRTFVRYWKEANKVYSEKQETMRNAVTDIDTQKAREALKKALNDKDKHAEDLLKQIERLESIVAGKAVKVGNEIIVATFSDERGAKAEIRAIKKLIGDWYGFNAPKQLDHTTNGQNINTPNFDLSRLSDKDLETLERISKKAE